MKTTVLAPKLPVLLIQAVVNNHAQAVLYVVIN